MTDPFDLTNLPQGEPTSLLIGNLWRWRRTDISATYDPTLFDLKYSFKRQASNPVTVTLTAQSDTTGFYAEVLSAVTGTYTPGEYRYQVYIERKSDGERIRVDDGTISFLVDLENDTSDTRSHAKKMVDLLEAALEARAGDGVLYYMIGDRQISKIPPRELHAMLMQYRAEYENEQAAEAIARGDANPNNIVVRFTND